MEILGTVYTEGLDNLKERIGTACTNAEHLLANEVKKDTSPYVPFLTGSLNEQTRVVRNLVIYPGPYARYLYYGKVMVDSATGKGPMHFYDKYGNEAIRFREGAILKATDKNLVFTTAHHAKAQSHWIEASKAQNMDKWRRIAEKAVKNGL